MMYLQLILLSLFILNSNALQCYQCDSSVDAYCPESWKRPDLAPKDCGHVDYPAFCVKTTGIYGGIVGTRRFCSSRHLDNACQEIQYPQDKRIYYSCTYTCNTDGCNFAVKNAISKISMILIASAVFLLKKLF